MALRPERLERTQMLARVKSRLRTWLETPGQAQPAISQVPVSKRSGLIGIDYAPKETFGQAVAEAGIGYRAPELLTELTSNSFFVGEPRLTDLPDFFAPMFAAFAIAQCRGRRLRVLDFGGAIGRHRDYLLAAFGGTLELSWSVVETPLYVDYGRAHKVGGVHFATTIDEAGGPFDFVMFSGVLQYLDDWRPIVSHPVVQSTEYVFVSRTPFDECERIYLQTATYSDKVVRYAGRIVPKEDFTSFMSRTHTLFASWVLKHDMSPFGIFDAPAMLWCRE
jgi:putative methyltransferase (TIGR04325 family)